jgi:nucleoside-diphosphate-sugar epimerase
MKVLVTGGMGYVGSRLCPHLLAAGHEVRALDLGLYGEAGLRALEEDDAWSVWQNRFEWVRGDIRDPECVRKSLEGVDAVIHLAAISNDPTGELDEVLTRQVNFDAVGLLLCIAKQSGVRRFINASSSSVFGIKDVSDVVESLEPEPITSYSRNKMMAEWLVLSARMPGFVTVNVRPATICGYSPRQRFDLTVNKLTADAIRKGVITVHGGQQRRPNVSMTDMINLYGILLEVDDERIDGRTFNFGFENHPIIEIAELIRDELSDLDVRIDRTEVFDQRDYHIASHSLLEALSYEPVSSIAGAVAELRHCLLDEGLFPDIDAKEHYNLEVMSLERNADPYTWLARGAASLC